MDHFRASRLPEADQALCEILAAAPDHVPALDLLGCVAQHSGQYERARTLFRRAVNIAPNDPFLHFNLGVTLEEQGESEAALASFLRVLKLNPKHVRARTRCAELLDGLGRFVEAVGHYRYAVAGYPDDAAMHTKLGNALQHLEYWEEAENHYRRALRLRPDYPAALNNLGVVLQRRDRLDEAESCYRRALTLIPDYTDAHNNLGNLLQERLMLDEAVDHYRKAASDSPRARWNLGTALLLRGAYHEGLACYESRFEGGDEAVGARRMLVRLGALPRWRGGAIGDGDLLVWAEQGLGDTLMMLRYLPLLAGRGVERIVVAAPPPLLRLVRGMGAVSAVIASDDPVPATVVAHCPMMSLPHVFGTRLDSIPGVPYLEVAPRLSEPWRRRLAAYGGLKVGLVWAGSPTQRHNRRRSIDFARLAPLTTIPGVQFFSLQKPARAHPDCLIDWMAECADLLDTAALIDALDLVISVDTAVAHLAGALAKPVWLLNRYESEWRWLLDREDAPWYPGMRIFRQPAPGDWDTVIIRARAALRQSVGQTPSE